MKTISEEYIWQLSRMHEEKKTFGDAKGLKSAEKYIKKYNINIENIFKYDTTKNIHFKIINNEIRLYENDVYNIYPLKKLKKLQKKYILNLFNL